MRPCFPTTNSTKSKKRSSGPSPSCAISGPSTPRIRTLSTSTAGMYQAGSLEFHRAGVRRDWRYCQIDDWHDPRPTSPSPVRCTARSTYSCTTSQFKVSPLSSPRSARRSAQRSTPTSSKPKRRNNKRYQRDSRSRDAASRYRREALPCTPCEDSSQGVKIILSACICQRFPNVIPLAAQRIR